MRHLRQVVATYRKDGFAPTYTTDVTITEFSLRASKPVLVLDRQHFRGIAGGPEVEWVNASGSVLIVDHQVQPPDMAASNARVVLGVQTGHTFTPLPSPMQPFLTETVAW
jgi:hypothetical protein